MKRILLQYDIAHGRLPRPERILEQAFGKPTFVDIKA